MTKTLTFFIRHYIFWFIIFIFFRALFLTSIFPSLENVTVPELIHTMIAGFRLDLSTASYFAIFPFIFMAFSIAGGDNFLFSATKVYYALVLFIVVVLSLSNIIVFRYWGTLLNSRGLAFAAQPAEMFASVTTIQILMIFGIIAVLFFGGRKFYTRFLHPAFENISGTATNRIASLIVILPLIIIGLRGGLQLIPVNESSATFSSHRTLNQIAINNIWYLGHNLKQSGMEENNPYVWMDDSTASRLVHSMVKGKNTQHVSVFNLQEQQPNVVFILLESWTADIIEPLGGLKGVTPRFTELCKEGLLFTSVYSSGFRTDQALVSVLSGFPSQPNKSIIRFPDKTAQLPSIAGVLKKNGYHTSFYYGGELGFANMNSYLLSSGFDNTTGIEEFESGQRNSKWGAHDQFVLEKQISGLQNEKQPFFSVLLTLSTHEPFEVPVNSPFNGKTEPELFKKSAWYTDSCLGNYFEEVRKSPWHQNTIFILLADHGHRLPLKRDYFDPSVRRIPLLIWSPLLKQDYQGTVNSAVAGQHDVAATLLASLGLPHDSFDWSNDLLNPARYNFSYLSLDIAVTWLQDSLTYTIPLEPGLPGYGQDLPGQKEGKAYLQHLYGSFLAY